jgi:hypothetical protein
MKAIKQEDGSWLFEPEGGQKPLSDTYAKTLAKYLTCLEPAFSKAADRCEFEFIHCLLRVRGIQGAGWDPYITTYSAIDSMTKLHEGLDDPEAARHRAVDVWPPGRGV